MRPACPVCCDEGSVPVAKGGLDACGLCTRKAEIEWVSRRPQSVIRRSQDTMKSIEQIGPEGAGTVTAACVLVAARPHFELTVHPAVLRAMTWFRGGRDVAVVTLGDSLRVTHPGPHRLLAKVTNRLDKLPPVQLRIPRFEHMRSDEMPAEVVPYEVLGIGLVITLPAWARPPAPHPAPFTMRSMGGVR